MKKEKNFLTMTLPTKELRALQSEARLALARALRHDSIISGTNAELNISQILHARADKAFDVYNSAFKAYVEANRGLGS